MALGFINDHDRASPGLPPLHHGGRGARIGDFLRDTYDDVLAEPLPDIFADLLRKLG